MRIVFMGTPEFAVPSLEILVDHGYEIAAVITAPDKPAGRGLKLNLSPVKKYALEKGLRILQPVNLKDSGFLEELKSIHADIQFVVGFRMLPEVVWNMPAHGTYNLHASLLPEYRGAAPINHAIMNGEKVTGVTTFKLKHKIDTGNILFSEAVQIDDHMNAGELHDKLKITGAALVLKTVRAIENHIRTGRALEFRPQHENEGSDAPRITRETCRIKWEKTGNKIHDQVRGLSPYPAAFTRLEFSEGKFLMLKIYSSNFIPGENDHVPGSIETDCREYLNVYCKGGKLALLELQAEGKKRMSTAEFLRGFRLASGMKFN